MAAATAAAHQLQSDSTRTLRDVDLLAQESRRQIEINGNDLDRLLEQAGHATSQADLLIAMRARRELVDTQRRPQRRADRRS